VDAHTFAMMILNDMEQTPLISCVLPQISPLPIRLVNMIKLCGGSSIKQFIMVFKV
jgi:hypothetical protein